MVIFLVVVVVAQSSPCPLQRGNCDGYVPAIGYLHFSSFLEIRNVVIADISHDKIIKNNLLTLRDV
jgi:hypothetical protein